MFLKFAISLAVTILIIRAAIAAGQQALICTTSLAQGSDLPSNHQALKSITGKNRPFLFHLSNEYHHVVTMVMEQGHQARTCDGYNVVLCSLPLGTAALTECGIGRKFAPSRGLLPTNSRSIFGVLRGGRLSAKS